MTALRWTDRTPCCGIHRRRVPVRALRTPGRGGLCKPAELIAATHRALWVAMGAQAGQAALSLLRSVWDV
jgi:hypothetical protein